MSQFSEKTIDTMDVWNTLLIAGCCCPMPECPAPTMECESVIGSAWAASGFVNPEDSIRYAKKILTSSGGGTTTANSTSYRVWQGSGFSGTIEGPSYVSSSTTVVDGLSLVEEYAPPIATSVCGEADEYVYSSNCAGSKTITQTTTVGVYSTVSGHTTKTNSEVTTTYTLVAGNETEEHAQWVADWTDQETWQAAHDAWVIEFAAWEAASAAYDEWVNAGEIGDPPIVPAQPEEPPAEPGATYADCTYKITVSTTDYDISYGASGFTSEVAEGSPSEYSYYGNAGMTNPVLSYATPITPTAVTQAALTLMSTVDMEGCSPKYTHCSATLDKDASDFTQSARKVRFRFVIPQTFKGSHAKVTWDILEEPYGWDHPTPTAARTLTPGTPWTWTGPGDVANADSWKSPWFTIDPPSTRGMRSVVNLRVECLSTPTQFGKILPRDIPPTVTLDPPA